MAPVQKKNPRLKAVVRINKALETSVMEILRDLMPEVRALPRHNAIHYILDDLGLLARCFIAYRENPEKFRRLLVAPRKGGHVGSSQDTLTCGRSFDDIIGMIVRTAAKRHFLQEVDGDMRPFRAGRYLSSEEMNIVQLVFSAFGQKFARPAVKTRGIKLYEALSDNIKFDWQVPLVPEYATLPLAVIQQYGDHILDYKLASEIQQIRKDPEHPPPPSTLVPRPLFVPPPPEVIAQDQLERQPEPPAAEPVEIAAVSGTPSVTDRVVLTEVPSQSQSTDRRAKLDEILTGDGKRLKTTSFNAILLAPKVQALLPENVMSIRVGDSLNQVGGNVAKLFVSTLGLRQDQLAVLLICAQQAFGEKAFANLFGQSGRLETVTHIVSRMQDMGINQDTPLETIAALANRKFTG